MVWYLLKCLEMVVVYIGLWFVALICGILYLVLRLFWIAAVSEICMYYLDY